MFLVGRFFYQNNSVVHVQWLFFLQDTWIPSKCPICWIKHPANRISTWRTNQIFPSAIETTRVRLSNFTPIILSLQYPKPSKKNPPLPNWKLVLVMGAFVWKFLNSNLCRCHQLWPNKWVSDQFFWHNCTLHSGSSKRKASNDTFRGHGLTASLPLKLCQAPKGKDHLPVSWFFQGRVVKLRGLQPDCLHSPSF